MREVLADRLWIGNALEARDYRRLHEVGIRAIVDLALEEKPCQAPREMIYLRYPLHDGADNSSDTLAMVLVGLLQLLEREIPSLVACSAGMSRSPSVVAAALAVRDNVDPHEWLNKLAAGHGLDVSPPILAAHFGSCDAVNMTFRPVFADFQYVPPRSSPKILHST